MTKEENPKKIVPPYNTDTTVLRKIIDDLKNSGSDGVNLKTLWANIDETKNLNKSYTLNMAKFLNLVDTDNVKVWLTPLGRSIGYLSEEKRNTLLAQNLPEIYMTMFKWLKYSPTEDMLANDFKVRFINTFGDLSSPVLLDRAIASFLHYCESIGLLKYVGRGRGAKAILTEFGKKVLDLPQEDVKNGTPKQPKQELSKSEPSESLQGEYPIRITTKDRVFDWDIKTDADLQVIDSVVNSIKEIWKSKKDKKAEGKRQT